MKQCYNILMLGETGVGKSTLINSFANYSSYRTFEEALKADLVCLIPTKFSVTDEYSKEVTIEVGESDDNECLDDGQSATQSCKSYVFDIDDQHQLRWIDTSGFADTKGTQKDEETVDDIINYVLNFKTIHAIAIVAKANAKSFSGQFQDCLKNTLRELHFSVKRIFFIFTHGQKPAGVVGAVTKCLHNISQELEILANLKPNKSNTFCFENEPFRNLIAAKQNVKINAEASGQMWKTNTNEFQRFLNAVVVNECKDFIIIKLSNYFYKFVRHLSIYIGHIMYNIHQNKSKIQEWQKLINKNGKCRLDLETIYVRAIEEKISVCASNGCATTYKTSNEHYRCFYNKICFSGTAIYWTVSYWIKQIFTNSCNICPCKRSEHELLNYEIKSSDQHIPAQTYKMHKLKLLDENNKTVKEYLDELICEENTLEKIILQLINLINKQEDKSDIQKLLTERLKSIVNYQGKLADTHYTISDDVFENIQDQLKSLEIYGPLINFICETAELVDNSRDRNANINNSVFRIS